MIKNNPIGNFGSTLDAANPFLILWTAIGFTAISSLTSVAVSVWVWVSVAS